MHVNTATYTDTHSLTQPYSPDNDDDDKNEYVAEVGVAIIRLCEEALLPLRKHEIKPLSGSEAVVFWRE